MRRRDVLRGLLGLSLAPLACAPSPRTPGTPAPPTAGQLAAPVRLAWADVGTPNPFRVSTAGPGGAVLLTLLYDTLTWKDERGIVPWLARRWDVSDDGREYTFRLVSTATWHDGKPLTAEDVAFSFDFYARHPYRWTSTSPVESAVATTPDTVRIRLEQPFAPFLEDVAGVVPIIPKHVWSSVGDPLTYDGPGVTLGSGLFQLADYRSADGSYRLLANPNYSRGVAAIHEFQQLATPPATRVQAMQQGQLELNLSTDASVIDFFRDHPRVRVFETPPLSIVRLAVNTERPPLNDPAVRQAITHALDQAQIARAMTKGTPIVGSAGVIPPETPWFNPNVRRYDHDPTKAKALLDGRRLTVELLADPTYREPELMQPMLDAVGITLSTKRVDGQTRTQLLREGQFQLGLVQHIGVGGDPDFLRRWYAGEETNDYAQGSVWRQPDFTDLGRRQAAATDPDQRRELVHRMQAILADELPTIVLYHRRFYWLYDGSLYAPMNTWGGLLNGVPLVHNRLTFLRR